MFLPIGILLAAAFLLISKKKSVAPPKPQAPAPALANSIVETTTKTPAKTPTKATSSTPPKSSVIEVGTGHLSDVLFGPVRQTTTKATTTTKAPTKAPAVVTTSPSKTLGDIFWGAVR